MSVFAQSSGMGLTPISPETDGKMEPIAVTPSPITETKRVVVVIDPGHGGSDSGAVGPNGVKEKDVVLGIAEEVVRLCGSEKGLEAVLTREGRDVDASEASRVAFASQKVSAAAVVSLHVGASFAPNARGMEIFLPTFSETEGDEAVRSPQGGAQTSSSAGRQFGGILASSLASSTGATVRGVRNAPVRLLSSFRVPSVMIEVGVISNPEDETLLASKEYQTKIAEGIVRGLVEFFSERPSGE